MRAPPRPSLGSASLRAVLAPYSGGCRGTLGASSTDRSCTHSARNCVAAIQKRFTHRSANVQLFSLTVRPSRALRVRALLLVSTDTQPVFPGYPARRRARQQLRRIAPPRGQRQGLHPGIDEARQRQGESLLLGFARETSRDPRTLALRRRRTRRSRKRRSSRSRRGSRSTPTTPTLTSSSRRTRLSSGRVRRLLFLCIASFAQSAQLALPSRRRPQLPPRAPSDAQRALGRPPPPRGRRAAARPRRVCRARRPATQLRPLVVLCARPLPLPGPRACRIAPKPGVRARLVRL